MKHWAKLISVVCFVLTANAADDAQPKPDPARIRYGMTLSALYNLIGSADHTSEQKDDEIVLQYSGKRCIDNKACFVNVVKGMVVGYAAFKPAFVEDAKHRPKIRIGMSLASLHEAFGDPWKTNDYSEKTPGHVELMLIYAGVICKNGKMCPVIVRDGKVVQHEFDASYAK